MPSQKSDPKPKLDQPLHQWSFDAIGTRWWIGIYKQHSTDELSSLQQAVTDRIEQFDIAYSRFREDSLVTRIAQNAGTYDLPADATNLLQFYRDLYDVSDGKVTPLIGQTLSDAGYDANYSLMPGDIQAPPAWDDVMSSADGKLTTTQPLLLDFGAAGKGYLVDIISKIIQDSGISSFCVDAGGDMYAYNTPLLRIGLENPDDITEAIGVFDLQNGALCGSAGNRRAWDTYHHILDPVTLDSPQHIKALWVSADTALQADGLATALFFVDPDVLSRQFTFNYLLLLADGSVKRSADFPAKLFILEDTHE